jgi:hypothetical protein
MLVACRLAGLSARFSTTTTQCRQFADLVLEMLILINLHMRNARSPKAERDGGFRRNVDDSATDKRTSPNDRDDHATAVTEVEDPHPRSYR